MKLFFTLKDGKLSIAFSLKHEIFIRIFYCGFLRRDTGRAIAVNKIQEYFEGNVFVLFYLLFASTDFYEYHFDDYVYLLQGFGRSLFARSIAGLSSFFPNSDFM